MATLADMKSRIADELARNDLAAPIASAIADAIGAYQTERFFFNESRDLCTFNTVVGQQFYGASDHALIPDILAIDYVAITVGSIVSLMSAARPAALEDLGNAGTQRGEPYAYAWYDRKLRLYPPPGQVYPVRIAGHFRLGAPASDLEAGNVWMVEAERLIRSRAKYELAIHWLKDGELATTMAASVTEALDQLKARTNRQTATGIVQPTRF